MLQETADTDYILVLDQLRQTLLVSDQYRLVLWIRGEHCQYFLCNPNT